MHKKMIQFPVLGAAIILLLQIGVQAQGAQTAASYREVQQLAKQGKYREAIRAFDILRAQKPQIIKSVDLANMVVVYALVEDSAGHKQFAEWGLDRYEGTRDPFDAEHVAKAYLLYPGAKDKTLLAKSAKLAQIGVDTIEPDRQGRSWVYLAHAMARIRLRDHDEAQIWLQKSLKNTGAPIIHGMTFGYIALNEVGKGNTALAAKSLQKAKGYAATLPRNSAARLNPVHIIIKEVETLLKSLSSR
ncbi:MAG: hypothetical protein ACI8W8_002555, partial [Rhodothermales bacterium]